MMQLLATESILHGPILGFLVLFAVILFGPIVLKRFGCPD